MARNINDVDFSNVADMGFGISQVLPIAAQLWASSSRYFSGPVGHSAPTIVIEQPELHLHPAFQANLADVFAGVVKSTRTSFVKDSPPTLVIETHSQQIVNRLGQLIEEGKLASEDVSIVLFEPNPDVPGTAKVRTATFDTDGVLQNWPFGFFEPDYVNVA